MSHIVNYVKKNWYKKTKRIYENINCGDFLANGILGDFNSFSACQYLPGFL